ncbi:hypothetical protein PAXINDRAFT_17439 [Paxillus involutus ATCC 200175]|uniref:Uncharacterized protein n=1 Tax=Paxillus involutus ATCC 200175 TaxID=664439 RepID=A0A0C9TNT7_PAXIN|nr:hypothetical protein PAXINDRAFT_17439 [Paxillus involutus ATCC 200175]
MPIGINPHNAQAPVYNHERFRATRQPFVDDFNITHEQAAHRLTNIWQAQNLVERQEWDLRQEEDDEVNRQDQERRQQQEECQRLLEEELQQVPPIQQSSHIFRHSETTGLAEAEASSHSLDDDAFALTKNDNGHHSFIPIAATKAKEMIIPDKDLTWAEIDKAAPRLLLVMKENGWDEERVQSHLQFLMALSSHEYRHDADEYGKHAMIVYQDIIRRCWHNLLGTTQSFDLVPIDKSMIKEIRDDLLYKANKSLKDEAMQVSQPVSP